MLRSLVADPGVTCSEAKTRRFPKAREEAPVMEQLGSARSVSSGDVAQDGPAERRGLAPSSCFDPLYLEDLQPRWRQRVHVARCGFGGREGYYVKCCFSCILQ